ncbi:MAG TPA: GTPase [Patescibacteria group bacterium]|nr:GTPase [Patescibacteria group bacterium]
MLIDRAEITIRGGHGGVAMPKKLKGRDGGNGGRGGDVYIVGSSDITLLNQFSEKIVFVGENGAMGGKKNMTGKSGADLEIFLPIGTSIIDKKTKELIFEVTKPNERFKICRGGQGGIGSILPDQGKPGTEKKVILNLKLIANFGLIGLPNAGKSSLLNELTNAKAKTANYAFTTLEPNLGVFDGKYLADIPGLIEGASIGKGLGIGFLKHIEKVGMLFHCISCESDHVIEDYEVVRQEMKKFNPLIIKKPEIILLTKSDLVEPAYIIDLVKILRKKAKKIIPVSIYDFTSLENLKVVIQLQK